VASFRKRVLTYYKKSGRHTLPWRKTHDPYRILVSEIMLQQTQVDRVIPYYKRFLKRFPNVNMLARASLSDVLREWSGLGYNRRAKFLYESARAIVARGGIPHAYKDLRALPGVGEYTAKAVRVFAYNEPEIMLETNIRTALIHEFFPRKRMVSDKRIIPLLVATVKNIDSPREWYAALMDYGAHIKKEHGNATRRSRTYTKQKTFKGSLRQVRGAILRELTQGGPAKKVLGKKIGFKTMHVVRALKALERDGLVVRQGEVVSLA
jgi:A/G-specific adenine glycosylase